MRIWIVLSLAAFSGACGAPATPPDPPGSVRIEGKAASPGCGVYSHICEAKVVGVDNKAIDHFQTDAVVEPGIHSLTLICRTEYDPAASNSAVQPRVRNWYSRVMIVKLLAGVRYKVRYTLDGEECRLSLVESDSESEVAEVPH